ncbi:MAG TPA: transglutaminaseTgpA domain-containing protein [Bacillales bacterium]
MQRADHWFMTLLLYALGFLLFWEWLRPLAIITNTGSLSVFVMYTAFAFLLSYLQLPFWITTPAKILAMLYALHSLFFSYFIPFFDPKWLAYFIKDTVENVGLLFAADWVQLSDVFRSLLFFVLLWLVSYLMHYWLIQARRVFLFFLVTVLYVTIIDTFTMYDATAAIVRTVVIGFILLGLLRFIKLQEEEEISAPRGRFPLSWAAAMAVILLITTAVGFAAPKVEPQWPDPVPFIKSAAQGYGGSGGGGNAIQRIGYGTDDSRLGGPFVYDDTPVFTAITEDRRYWRVETKSIYTGKGWKSRKNADLSFLDLKGESAPDLYKNSVKTEEIQTGIFLADGRKFPQLVYGGELTKASLPRGTHLAINRNTEKIRIIKGGDQISVGHYTITYQKPEFTVKQLKKPGEDPPYILGRYLQLPDSLPDRVQKLTKKVTKDADNRYAKAKAVEQFFQLSKFSYNTQNVAVPGKNEDYVAQFLFESQRGYCDNFSSAMAVMLRTIGIPTRWVKGFTPGEFQKTLDNGREVYKITNANAHSWVEVYFPHAGWVPFEPTKGFQNTFNIVRVEKDADVDSISNEPMLPKNKDNTPKPQKRFPKPKASAGGDGSTGESTGWLTPLRAAVIIGVVLLIVVGVAYRTRKKWLPSVLRARYIRKSGEDVLLEAYERLLKLLPMYGLARNDNETLREFAVSVDQELGTHEMKALTASYEKARYRGDRSSEAWQESKDLWEAIINRLKV